MTGICNIILILISQMYGWNWSSIWLSVGSIGTLWLAIVTYQTVKEMKKSREISSKPQLILLSPQQEFDFLWTPGNPIESINPITYKAGTKDAMTGMPHLRLKNIGRGGAKNIRIAWSIEGKNLTNIISKNEELKRYNILIKYDYAIFPTIKDNITVYCSIECRDYETTDLEYCTASYDNQLYDMISIPEKIQGAYIIRLIIMERGKEALEFISAPTISISITYQDLYGYQYESKFELQSTFIYLTNEIITDVNSLKMDNLTSESLRGKLRFKIL